MCPRHVATLFEQPSSRGQTLSPLVTNRGRGEPVPVVKNTVVVRGDVSVLRWEQQRRTRNMRQEHTRAPRSGERVQAPKL